MISPFNNSETPEDITFIYAFMFTSYMCLYPVGKLPNKTAPLSVTCFVNTDGD